jgi:hypothetical protein
MEPTVLIAGMIGLLALAAKMIDFLRLLSNLPATKSSALTQALAWVGAIAIVFLYGSSQFGDTVKVDGLTLSDMDGTTKLLVGLAVGSLASLAKDFIKARDNTDSAKVPPLIGP